MNGEISRAPRGNNRRRMRVSQKNWLIGGKGDAWFPGALFVSFLPHSSTLSLSLSLSLFRFTSRSSDERAKKRTAKGKGEEQPRDQERKYGK